jgi:hypothetical protein
MSDHTASHASIRLAVMLCTLARFGSATSFEELGDGGQSMRAPTDAAAQRLPRESKSMNGQH